MSSSPVTSSSYIPVAQTDSHNQNWEETSSKRLRWKLIKSLGIAALSNLPGIIAIGYGAYTIKSNEQLNDECRSNYHKGTSTLECNSTALAASGSTLSLIFGFLFEAVAIPTTCCLIHEARTLLIKKSPEKIIELRTLISSSSCPEEFISAYTSKFPPHALSDGVSDLTDFVSLGILSQERVDEFNELLKRNKKLSSEQEAIKDVNIATVPFMTLDLPAIAAEKERLALEETDLKSAWVTFKKGILYEIPNPESV